MWFLLPLFFLCRPRRGNTDRAMADSACVVRSSRDEKPVHHTLKIESFSLVKSALASSKRDRLESRIFNVAGYKWKLALYPNGDEKRNGSGHISLYLVMADDNILLTTYEVDATFTFLVYDNLKDKYLTVKDGKTRCFSAAKKEWGFEKLVSLDTFNDVSNGFLVNDCCAFGVDIITKSDGKVEVFSLIKRPNNHKYTWKIDKLSLLDKHFYESDPFTVESYTWNIGFYPRGVHHSKVKPGSLSLYLKLNYNRFPQFHKGSEMYVEYEMAIVNQLGFKPAKIACNRWFGVNDTEARIGIASTISSMDFLTPTKGFIFNDTLIVEVKMNVISSSTYS